MTEIIPILWNPQTESVSIIDQTKIPYELKWLEINNYQEMANAIENMLLRGAPLIGIAAAYGLALAMKEQLYNTEVSKKDLIKTLEQACETLFKTRPTAVNLAWALNLMKDTIYKHLELVNQEKLEQADLQTLYTTLIHKATWIQEDDYNRCKMMSEHALKALKEELRLKILEKGKLNILTHCNAGALATGGYGTALGLIRSLHREKLLNMTYSDETRPRQQGSRLTAWELAEENIPVTMICDTMAGFLMQNGSIDAVVVGSDRITANGDVANKIGTYQVAILAKYHKIPFYVLAPESTIDYSLKSACDIKIEYRNSEELSHINGRLCTRSGGVEFINPGFDVTPKILVSKIITEQGIKEFE